MKILTTIKIRTKLMIIVGTMMIGIFAVGITGLYYNQKAEESLAVLYTKNMTATQYLSDLRTQSRANFANILNLVVTDDTDGQKSILEDFQKRTEKITTDLQSFQDTGLDANETTQVGEVQKNISAWNDISSQIMDLIAKGNKVDAIALFKTNGEPTFEALQTTVRDLETYQKDEAKSVFDKSELDSKNSITSLILIILFTLLICILLAYIISLSITKPIKKVLHLIKLTSELNLVYDNSFNSLLLNKDEIGDITRAVEDLRNSLRSTSNNLMSVAEHLSASSEELAASTAENTKTITQIVKAINEIAEGNSSQADEVSKTSKSISEMAEHVETINQISDESAKHAQSSIEIINEGQDAVNLTVDKINDSIRVSDDVNNSISELSSQMGKVKEIVDVIRQISSQTNLLALNASIEAARAGEAGRGFAVVASEIGTLAKNTSSAVDNIADIIDTAVAKNTTTSEKIGEVRTIVSDQEKSIHVMEDSFSKIKISVEEITTQALDISSKISGVTVLAETVSDQMQDMSAISEETAASSEEISASSEEQLASMELLASVAGELAKMAENLNVEVNRFKL